MLSRPDGPVALKHLLRTNHDPEPRRRQHRRRAIAVYRSLEAAGVAERVRDADGRCAGVRVGSLVEGEDERSALRFSAPLMTFAIEVVATFDRDDPSYVADVVSVVESVLEDPRQILYAQQNAARAAEVARLKAEFVPYEERMERLEAISWPKPLAELLDTLFTTYRAHHPWLTTEPAPKSIVREMLESGDSFATFVRRYRLERSEGLVLRYLTDAWRALDRSLPDDVYTDELEDVVEWLGELIRATDATLLDEWTLLAGRPVHDHLAPDAPTQPGRSRRRRGAPPCAPPRSAGSSCWRARAYRRWPSAADGPRTTCARRWRRTGPSTTPSSPTPTPEPRAQFDLAEEPERWVVTQRLTDPAGDGEWHFVATVDLELAQADGAPSLQLESLGRF